MIFAALDQTKPLKGHLPAMGWVFQRQSALPNISKSV